MRVERVSSPSRLAPVPSAPPPARSSSADDACGLPPAYVAFFFFASAAAAADGSFSFGFCSSSFFCLASCIFLTMLAAQ